MMKHRGHVRRWYILTLNVWVWGYFLRRDASKPVAFSEDLPLLIQRVRNKYSPTKGRQ